MTPQLLVGFLCVSPSPTPLGDVPTAQPSRAAANGVSDGNTGDTYIGNAGDNGINHLLVGIYNAQGECVHGFYVFPNDVIRR